MSQYQLTAEESAMRKNTEKWLADHDAKLRQYAKALEARDQSGYWEEGDFYQVMWSKIWMYGSTTKKFFELSDAYILKMGWNEGLMMIRKQHKHNVRMTIPYKTQGESEWEDPIDNMPGLPSDNPETMKITDDDNDLLTAAIASLPIRSQQVCQLLYAGKKPVEIARQLSLSRSAVSERIAYIRGVFAKLGIQPATEHQKMVEVVTWGDNFEPVTVLVSKIKFNL